MPGASDFADLGAKPLGAADFSDLQDAPADSPSFMDTLAEKLAVRLLSGQVTPGPIAGLPAQLLDRKELGAGAVSGLRREEPAPEATISRRVGESAGRHGPTVAAQIAATAATGGASIPAQIGARALATGLAEAGQGSLSDDGASISGAAKAGGTSLAIDSIFAGAGVGLRAMKPALTRLGAQLIRSTSAVPEKYGKAVLENPRILTEAPSLKAASSLYNQAVRGNPGAREFLEKQTGDLLFNSADAVTMVNNANRKMGAGTLGLEEALASYQAANNLLAAAKMGNAEQAVNKAALIEFKKRAGEILNKGLPGFESANRAYFEANAREAFRSVFPKNRNMSPNVLRSLGGLAMLSAGAYTSAPALILGAAATSPRLTGLGISAGATIKDLVSSQAAQFAARVAAVNASRSGQKK